MDKSELLRQLCETLSAFRVYGTFSDELKQLIKHTGSDQRFLAKFLERLKFLKEHGVNAIVRHNEFERLNNDIYSFHITGKNYNIRILYTFLEDNTVLLLPFFERSGKRATNYFKKIPEAENRKEQLEGLK